MSSNLKVVDTTGAVVGQVFKADFPSYQNVDPGTKEPAHIRIYNESGVGLNAIFNASARQEFIPAGAWPVFELMPNDASIQFTVTYVLPSPPVNSINIVYYAPYETVPETPQLGNSPIGIGGSVNTSNVQTLSNEGSAAGLLIIDTGDATFSQVYTLFNDGHCVWSVDQAGTKHQVLKIQTSGNPLQLGQTADIIEVLGHLLVDTGFIGVLADGDLINANATQTIYRARGGDIIFETPSGTEVARFQNNQVLDLSRGSSVGQVKFKVGSINKMSVQQLSLTTSFANYAHLLGVVPDIVLGINDGTSTTISTMKWNKAASDGNNMSLLASANATFDVLALKT